MKIKKIETFDFEKLGNIKLDFTEDGRIKDTIIFAGNNGCGKTTILELIKMLADLDKLNYLKTHTGKLVYEFILSQKEFDEFIDNLLKNNLSTDLIVNNFRILVDLSKSTGNHERFTIISYDENHEYEIHSYDAFWYGKLESILSSFYSKANINYDIGAVNNVTTIELDEMEENNIITSSTDGTKIKQTLIDIDNLDAQDFQKWCENHIGEVIDETQMHKRLKRFTNAFKYIMDDIIFSEVINQKKKKEVLFERNNIKIKIDDLSSGEKQIVIRAGYMLRYLDSIKDSLILIDEPELSLHPEWQKKILNFYKKLFIDENGVQTSQIFIATHSPFIIHNSSRYNDKVIVLKRENGEIKIEEQPEYYNCNNMSLIEKAFNINEFNNDSNILFTEGETDKKYLEKAIELFLNNPNFKVEWIGKHSKNGNIVNTGCSALNSLEKILECNETLVSKKIGLLYDSDTNKTEISKNNYFVYTLKPIENRKYKIGIENLLNLPTDFDYEKYKINKTKEDQYGIKSTISELDKNKLCEDICASENSNEILKDFKDVLIEIDNKFI